VTKKSDQHGQPIIAGHAIAMHGTGQASTTSVQSNGCAAGAIPILLHLAVCHPVGEGDEVICRHWEHIVQTDDGLVGSCQYCGQEKIYKNGKYHIRRRGRLGGSVTMVKPPEIKKAPTKVI